MIAREGLIFIFSGALITILTILAASRWDSRVLFTISIIFGILTIFTTFFFRDPERSFTPEDGILISPADGKIIAIDTLSNHDYIGGEVIKVSIFLSVFNVHINRIPADGVIDYVKYNPGKFFAAFEDKASELNEQTEFGMTTKSGSKIVFKQIAGLIARRIIYNLNENDVVTAGDRFGLIRFGSRMELFVPAGTELLVKTGDIVKGSETIVGYLK